MSRRILVIEDDPGIAELLQLHLEEAGYSVERVSDGAAGLTRSAEEAFDLVVLDVGFPSGPDGLEVCRQLRARSRYVPILMLTARASEIDRVVGLEMGADDYLTKPFGVRELVARVKALFRRVDSLEDAAAGSASRPIEVSGLRIDPERRELTVDGKPMKLTAKEFDLLLHFARNPGRVFQRSQLLDAVWGYAHTGYEHTVNAHINRLRAKIERDPSKPTYIQTVWGVGYKFCDPDRPAEG
ncbi:MAG: response regulator transcription factor [Myxococcota bacterium]